MHSLPGCFRWKRTHLDLVRWEVLDWVSSTHIQCRECVPVNQCTIHVVFHTFKERTPLILHMSFFFDLQESSYFLLSSCYVEGNYLWSGKKWIYRIESYESWNSILLPSVLVSFDSQESAKNLVLTSALWRLVIPEPHQCLKTGVQIGVSAYASKSTIILCKNTNKYAQS